MAGAPVTRAERYRLMAQCHAQLAEFLRAEAAELDSPSAVPRKARRAAPPEPATARGIAIARQAARLVDEAAFARLAAGVVAGSLSSTSVPQFHVRKPKKAAK